MRIRRSKTVARGRSALHVYPSRPGCGGAGACPSFLIIAPKGALGDILPLLTLLHEKLKPQARCCCLHSEAWGGPQAIVTSQVVSPSRSRLLLWG